MSHETGLVRLKVSPDSAPAIVRSLPGISRINNRISLRTAAVLAGLFAAAPGCGGKATVEQTVVEQESCSPVADCPNPEIAAVGPYENFYDLTGRWRRYDPNTGDMHKVCEPSRRDFCEDGESPQNDGCEPAVCENVKPCDPVPSRKKDGSYRSPDRANFPTSSESADGWPWIQPDTIHYPVIYDNTPDCAPGETPVQGESYLTCDMIPTCEQTIPYCDPLPRCNAGESPITCETGLGGYSFEDDCITHMNNVGSVFSQYRLNIFPGIEGTCMPEWDASIGEYVYRPPIMKLHCLPTPECADGELPTDGTLTTHIDCGEWGSWISDYTYAPSCDPIKSCE